MPRRRPRAITCWSPRIACSRFTMSTMATASARVCPAVARVTRQHARRRPASACTVRRAGRASCGSDRSNVAQFTPAMRKQLAAASPKGGVDRIPAPYSKLGPSRRIAVRERYIEIQEGLCCHCSASLDGPPREDIACLPVDQRLFPPGFFTHPIHLHHDHKTDLTIGAVHAYCNAVLWQYHGE
jgi:hypothetical protein